MLATDLVMHSTKKLITHASLLTGDSDFLPALQIAQSEGVCILVHQIIETNLCFNREDSVYEKRSLYLSSYFL